MPEAKPKAKAKPKSTEASRAKARKANAEFQEKEFPAKAAAVIRKANATLRTGSGADKTERAQAFKARAAARRVQTRLGKDEAGKPKAKAAKKAPAKKGGSTPASRRRTVERATGMSKITDRLRGIQALTAAKKKKRGG